MRDSTGPDASRGAPRARRGRQDRDPVRVAVAAAAGAPGGAVPAVEVGGIGVIWAAMVAAIVARAHREPGAAAIDRLVVTAVGAVSGYVQGSRVLGWLAAPLIVAFPVPGVPAAVAVDAMLNGVFTLRLGLACTRRCHDPAAAHSDVLGRPAEIGSQLIGLPDTGEIQTIKEILAGGLPGCRQGARER